jgi:hypothetical protein
MSSTNVAILTIVLPCIFGIASSDTFLYIVAMYYMAVAKSDIVHHVPAALYCVLVGLFGDHEEQIRVGLLFVGAMGHVGWLTSKWGGAAARYSYVLTRVVVHPIAVVCLLRPIHWGVHAFFWAYALRTIIARIPIDLGVRVIFTLRSWFLGVPFLYVTDLGTIQKVLYTCSSKGDFLESTVAQDAWYPVKSVESEDGDQWKELRRDYNVFRRGLHSLQDLKNIAHTLAQQKLDRAEPIDAKQLTILVIQIMLRWLERDPSIDGVTMIAAAVNEWRMSLPCKEAGDIQLKMTATDYLCTTLGLPTAAIQPFVISPAINIVDIMRTWNDDARISTPTQAILAAHPFPYIERLVTKAHVDGIPAGTQVLIPMASIAKANPNIDWLAFGVGPRGCPGKSIALTLLKALGEVLLTLVLFTPDVNHRYSGRQNDSAPLSNPLYSIKTVLWAISHQ